MADYSLIISVCAIIIAIVTVIVSIWQGIVMRKHNRLSVTPHIRIDGEFNMNPDKDNKYILINSGIGPAVIMSIQIIIDGKILPEEGFSMFRSVFKLLNLVYDEATTWLPNKNDIIAPGEKFDMISICYGKNYVTTKEAIQNAIQRMGFVIKYKSIYGQEFSTQYETKSSQ